MSAVYRAPSRGSELVLECQHRHREITLIVAIGGERGVGLLGGAAEIDRCAIGRSRGRGRIGPARLGPARGVGGVTPSVDRV